MLELNIKGKDVGELYTNAMNTFLLLTQGGNKLFTPAQPLEEPVKVETPVTETAPIAEVLPNPPVVEPPKKRGRPAKPAPEPVTIEATATEIVDEDPLGLGDTKPAASQPMELTLDDMRDRVKAIIKAHNEDRGNSMPDCVAYVRKLFTPFGIKLAAELKEEQFAEFMAASDAYLDGSAK